MAAFYYVKEARGAGLYLSATNFTADGKWKIGKIPELFDSKKDAFEACEDLKTTLKLLGKPTTMMIIKEIEL